MKELQFHSPVKIIFFFFFKKKKKKKKKYYIYINYINNFKSFKYLYLYIFIFYNIYLFIHIIHIYYNLHMNKIVTSAATFYKIFTIQLFIVNRSNKTRNFTVVIPSKMDEQKKKK